MRSANLFVVALLGVILAVSSFNPVAAVSGIWIAKVTTNGDTTTSFVFEASWDPEHIQLKSGMNAVWFSPPLASGVYTVKELGPAGWALRVGCVGAESTFTYIPGGVRITYVAGDAVVCSFTNSPAPVGGVVIPANNFAIVAPWLAVIGLVGCVGTVVVVAKKRGL